MGITRVYTGDDGQSHFEDLELLPLTLTPSIQTWCLRERNSCCQCEICFKNVHCGMQADLVPECPLCIPCKPFHGYL